MTYNGRYAMKPNQTKPNQTKPNFLETIELATPIQPIIGGHGCSSGNI